MLSRALRNFHGMKPQQSTLRTRAMRGSIWMSLSHGSHQLLRLLSNIVLAYLLFPEAFGLMALVTIFIHGLQMFSDVGIRGSILYHKHGENPAFFNTAWTMQIIRGFVLWIIACALAYPASIFYGEPLLALMLPVAAVSVIFNGFRSTTLYTSQRRIHLGRVAAIDLASYSVSIVAIITWAFIHPTVWALVGGMLIGSFLHTAMSHVLLPGPRNRIHWDKPAFRSLVRFGKWVLVSTMATFLAANLDRLILGKLVPMDLLGIYSIAYLLAKTPGRFSIELMRSVLHPVYSEFVRRNDNQLGENVRIAREPVILLGLLLAMCIVFFAPALFNFVYDERYLDAGWMAPLLTLPIWFTLLQNSCDRALLASGDSKSSALANVVNALVTPVGCIIGFSVAGIPGLIVGTAVGNVMGLVVMHSCLMRRGIDLAASDCLMTSLYLLVLLAGLSVHGILPEALPGAGAIVHTLVVPFAVFLFGAALIGLRLYRTVLGQPGQGHAKHVAVENVGPSHA